MGPLEALKALANNRKIASPPLRVLLFVWPELDLEEFRPIKQEWVARHLHLTQPAVSGILRTLVAEQFLVVGERNGQANTYRINADHQAVRKMYEDVDAA